MSSKNWTQEQIESYFLGITYSDYPAVFWKRIERIAANSSSFRDIGSGPGAFALQAAISGLSVQAVDINRHNLIALRNRKAKLKLNNITVVQGDWLEVPADPVDLSVCAYSLGGSIGYPEGISKVLETTTTGVFWVAPYSSIQTDFMSEGLYQRFMLPPPSFNKNYLNLLQNLLDLQVKVFWEVVEYDFGIPYEKERGMDYYVRFLGEKLQLPFPAALREHINNIITEKNGLSWIPNPKKSVFITWLRSESYAGKIS